MKTPLIVTHPSTLLHDGLRCLLAKSQFGPLCIAPALNEELESQMGSFETCLWLMGLSHFDATTHELLRRVTTAAPGVKPVMLAACHAPGDVVAALGAGACGFLCQDIAAEQLLKSLELIACGQAVMHRDCHLGQPAPNLANDVTEAHGICQTQGVASDRDPVDAVETPAGSSASEVTHSLSRRELLILRMLTEGASNKVIALKMVITESTVKVHMKAILRKLRLQNRTQAAMWARNHVDQAVWIGLSTLGARIGPGHRDKLEALQALVC
jgi:two-component system nitrate/nitrite response regulator NarL